MRIYMYIYNTYSMGQVYTCSTCTYMYNVHVHVDSTRILPSRVVIVHVYMYVTVDSMYM